MRTFCGVKKKLLSQSSPWGNATLAAGSTPVPSEQSVEESEADKQESESQEDGTAADEVGTSCLMSKLF